VLTGQAFPNECERIHGVISACLDGEVSEVEQAKMGLHLASCGECREYASQVADTSRLLRDTPLEDLGFAIVLPSRRLRLARTLQVGAAAAAIAVTVALGSTIGATQSGNLGALSSASASGSNAYLQSPEYELRMLARASSANVPARAHYAR
jgi:predicted anti-sigma-YlaC factor YlaD